MNPRLSKQKTAALTLFETIVVIVVLAIALAMILPALAKAKHRASKLNCASNIKQIGIAFRVWEGDHGDKYPMSVSVTNGGAMELVAAGNIAVCFQVMSNELCTPKILLCPEDTHRVYATNFSTGFSGANISYFLNPDAVEAYPQMILDGDSNLQVNGKPVQRGLLDFRTVTNIAWAKDRHHGVGNIGMADGSAQQATSGGLNSAFGSCTNSVPTNNTAIRWLIP